MTNIHNLQFRIELRSTNDELVTTLGNTFFAGELPLTHGWVKLTSDPLTIPATVPNGKYRLCTTFKAGDQTEFWAPHLRNGAPQCVNVEIASDRLIFGSPSESMPSLILNGLITEGNLYQNETGHFMVSIKNAGTRD